MTESSEPPARSERAQRAASESEIDAGSLVLAAVDPEKLLAAANASSGPGRTAWLAFLGLVGYLLITLSGVTHVDLLLNGPVTLPIVNVDIPLFSFFLAAPFLFLLVHLGLLMQHAILAHKYHHFSLTIAESEKDQAGEHPDRKLVHSYVFSQMLAGPSPPWVLHLFMRLIVFATFCLLPVLVLLYFQVKFLPSHDVATTHAHRLALLLDLVLLFVIWPFFAMPHLVPRGRRLSLGQRNWRWELSYTSLGLGGFLGLVVVSFSLLIATVPGRCFSPWADHPANQDIECFSLDRTTAGWWPLQVQSGVQWREVFAPTKWLFEGKVDRTGSVPQSPFSRNLVVIDNQDLVRLKDLEGRERSLQLRGRDLRFAVLDLSDLRRADLSGSDLSGVSADSTQLSQANLRMAKLQGASLSSAELQGADLRGAMLEGAALRNSKLQGANLAQAVLQGADLSGAQLQGANLWTAQLQGANLFGAQLLGVDLYNAGLQAADLRGARLHGSGLRNAQVQGAILYGTGIWQTEPPDRSRLQLAIPPINASPLTDGQKRKLRSLVSQAESENWQWFLRYRVERLLDADQEKAWEKSKALKLWINFSRQADPDPNELANYLAELWCIDDLSSYAVEGIARSVISYATKLDRGTELIASTLLKKTCRVANRLSKDTQVRLNKIAGIEDSEIKP